MADNNLHKFADTLESVRRILTNGIWIAIVIILLASLGWFLAGGEFGGKDENTVRSYTRSVQKAHPSINWQEVDQDLVAALREARMAAREYAEAELDIWIATMMERVDDSFLEWYFSYWTQQVLGLKGLYQYGAHYVLKTQPTATEKLTEEIQQEFSTRVLRPQIAQRVLERIVQQSAEIYVANLVDKLNSFPETYKIPQPVWSEYLEDISVTAEQSDGNRTTPLTLKALTVTGAGGTVLLIGHLKAMLGKVGAKVMTKSSSKLASSMAAKTGGKVVAKVGGKFFGTIAGFGVLVWDIWDHTATEKDSRPLLRDSLEEYFQELKIILLDDPDYGVMTTFLMLEADIARNSELGS